MTWAALRTGNPAIPFVRFYVNSHDLLEFGTWRLQSFSHERSSEIAAGSKVSLTVFDENWFDIEGILFAPGGSKDVYFEYGWTNGDVSPVYYGMFHHVKPNFNQGGVVLTIEASGLPMEQHLVQKSDTFKGLRISDIVEVMATKLGYDIGHIEKTRPVSGIGDPTSAHRTFQMHNMTFYQFVRNVLTPYAVSESSGQGGYVLWFDNSGTTPSPTPTKPKLYYAPADYSPASVNPSSIIRDYTVYRHRMSEVISFEPDMDLLKLYAISGGVVNTSTVDPISGAVVPSNYDPKVVGTALPTPAQVKTSYHNSTDGPTRVLMSPGQSKDDVATRQEAVCRYSRNEFMTANLTVIGDPWIVPMKYLRINLFTSRGTPHYASGYYQIIKASDLIQGSQYTTSMEIRTATTLAGTDMATRS